MFLVFAVLLAALPAVAQEPARIRVTTRMVEVSVVARDRQGRAVGGLTREDFRVYDGGQEEQIRGFHAPERPAGTGDDTPAGAVAILFDNLNNRSHGHTGYARWSLAGFFREMEPRQPIALLSMDEEFHVLHGYSRDGASLAAALEAYHPKASLFNAASAPRRVPGVRGRDPFSAVDGLAGRTYAEKRARMTSAGAAMLARFLAEAPGRKSLVWFSSVFPAYLAAAVANDDVAIYPVDASTPIDGPSKAARLLAERTGGAAFWNGNDLAGPLRQAYEDRAAAYLLGYYPSHSAWDRRFRPIRVTVSRPDVELRHRAGYPAIPEPDAPGDARRPAQ